jgi:RNA polymerase sigma-70 factor (ECF subfamily)
MDIGRSQRRRDVREASARRADESAFEHSLDRAERQALIESVMNQLPGDQREVVVMKIWGGLTFAQIAQGLKIPAATAASRYRYALARLTSELSQELANE